MAFHFMTGRAVPSLPSLGWSPVFSPAAGACGLPNPALAFSALLLWISQPSNSLTWVQPGLLKLFAVLVVDGMGRGLGNEQNDQCRQDDFVHAFLSPTEMPAQGAADLL